MSGPQVALAELPREAHLRYDAVPSFPTMADFQAAAAIADRDKDPVAIWHREAMRWRTANEGRPLDLSAIADAVLRAMHG